MADAYGGISLSTSKDSEINAALLVELLNHYTWTNSGGEWTKHETNGKDIFWHRDNFGTQYPSLFPCECVAVLIKEGDETIRRIPAEQATEEDYDQCWDMEEEDISLEALSNHFSKAITNGWFEIACTANEKNRYVYFQSLRIYAGGKAVRKSIFSGCCIEELIDDVEIFNPN